MRSFITIDRLQIFARHGVLDQEHSVGNLFEVSVTVEYDITEAARTDDVGCALNYAELTELVIDTMSLPRKLIESVAVDIQRRIVERWPAVASGTVAITKLHPPIPAPTPRATITLSW